MDTKCVAKERTQMSNWRFKG